MDYAHEHSLTNKEAKNYDGPAWQQELLQADLLAYWPADLNTI